MFDSQNGLFYDIDIGGKNPGFTSPILRGIEIKESIFNFFPSLTFYISNRENFYIKQGYGTIGAPLKMTIGRSIDDEEGDTDIINDFILQDFDLGNSGPTLDSFLTFNFTHKKSQELVTDSPARAYKDKLSSEVIEDIILNKNSFPDTSVIEKTKNKGIWLKPSNQSDKEFIDILQQRSFTSTRSKMFSWISYDGNYNFRSLHDMIKQRAKVTIDLKDEVTSQYMPVDFRAKNTGIFYKDQDVNQKYCEYVFDLIEGGELKTIKPPDIVKIGNKTKNIQEEVLKVFKRTNPEFIGFSHSKVPSGYNEAVYLNKCFVFPIRFKFRIKHLPKQSLRAGNMIALLFPMAETLGWDPTFSGLYLITSITRGDKNQVYFTDLEVMSNSALLPELLFKPPAGAKTKTAVD